MGDDIFVKPEKRQYQRVDVSLPVNLKVSGKEIPSITENISCGGMLLRLAPVQTHATIQANSPLEAQITLAGTTEKIIHMQGRVIRVDTAQDGERRAAIEFSGLYDENMMEIDHLVKWNKMN